MGKRFTTLDAYGQEIDHTMKLIVEKTQKRTRILETKATLDKEVDDFLNKAIAVDGEIRALEEIKQHLLTTQEKLWQEKQAQKEARAARKAKK
jgi:7,8-dihydro-6-hydroxymethylpterin-pyrophosphokinase